MPVAFLRQRVVCSKSVPPSLQDVTVRGLFSLVGCPWRGTPFYSSRPPPQLQVHQPSGIKLASPSSLASPQILLRHFLHFRWFKDGCDCKATFEEWLLNGQPHTEVQVSIGTSQLAPSTSRHTLSLELCAVDATHSFLGS